jgi:hypothetical protein
MAHHLLFAGVAELADAPDLGSGAARRGGSSPFTRTFNELLLRAITSFDKHRSQNILFKCGSSSVVEYNLAKVGVAGSNPVFRSKKICAGVAELADAQDLKSCGR